MNYNYLQAIGQKTQGMDLGHTITWTAILTKVNGYVTKEVEKDNIMTSSPMQRSVSLDAKILRRISTQLK